MDAKNNNFHFLRFFKSFSVGFSSLSHNCFRHAPIHVSPVSVYRMYDAFGSGLTTAKKSTNIFYLKSLRRNGKTFVNLEEDIHVASTVRMKYTC